MNSDSVVANIWIIITFKAQTSVFFSFVLLCCWVMSSLIYRQINSRWKKEKICIVLIIYWIWTEEDFSLCLFHDFFFLSIEFMANVSKHCHHIVINCSIQHKILIRMNDSRQSTSMHILLCAFDIYTHSTILTIIN